MKNVIAAVGIVPLLFGWVVSQPAYGNVLGCLIVSCDQEIVSCTPIEINHMMEQGSSAGGGGPMCTQKISEDACNDNPTCERLLAQRQVPAVGASALGLTGVMLAAWGAFGLRRRNRRRS